MNTLKWYVKTKLTKVTNDIKTFKLIQSTNIDYIDDNGNSHCNSRPASP